MWQHRRSGAQSPSLILVVEATARWCKVTNAGRSCRFGREMALMIGRGHRSRSAIFIRPTFSAVPSSVTVSVLPPSAPLVLETPLRFLFPFSRLPFVTSSSSSFYRRPRAILSATAVCVHGCVYVCVSIDRTPKASQRRQARTESNRNRRSQSRSKTKENTCHVHRVQRTQSDRGQNPSRYECLSCLPVYQFFYRVFFVGVATPPPLR